MRGKASWTEMDYDGSGIKDIKDQTAQKPNIKEVLHKGQDDNNLEVKDFETKGLVWKPEIKTAEIKPSRYLDRDKFTPNTNQDVDKKKNLEERLSTHFEKAGDKWPREEKALPFGRVIGLTSEDAIHTATKIGKYGKKVNKINNITEGKETKSFNDIEEKTFVDTLRRGANAVKDKFNVKKHIQNKINEVKSGIENKVNAGAADLEKKFRAGLREEFEDVVQQHGKKAARGIIAGSGAAALGGGVVGGVTANALNKPKIEKSAARKPTESFNGSSDPEDYNPSALGGIPHAPVTSAETRDKEDRFNYAAPPTMTGKGGDQQGSGAGGEVVQKSKSKDKIEKKGIPLDNLHAFVGAMQQSANAPTQGGATGFGKGFPNKGRGKAQSKSREPITTKFMVPSGQGGYANVVMGNKSKLVEKGRGKAQFKCGEKLTTKFMVPNGQGQYANVTMGNKSKLVEKAGFLPKGIKKINDSLEVKEINKGIENKGVTETLRPIAALADDVISYGARKAKNAVTGNIQTEKKGIKIKSALGRGLAAAGVVGGLGTAAYLIGKKRRKNWTKEDWNNFDKHGGYGDNAQGKPMNTQEVTDYEKNQSKTKGIETKALVSPSVLRSGLNAAKRGAVPGAIAGAATGAASDSEDRIGGALRGGLVGGALGAAIPGGAAMLGKNRQGNVLRKAQYRYDAARNANNWSATPEWKQNNPTLFKKLQDQRQQGIKEAREGIKNAVKIRKQNIEKTPIPASEFAVGGGVLAGGLGGAVKLGSSEADQYPYKGIKEVDNDIETKALMNFSQSPILNAGKKVVGAFKRPPKQLGLFEQGAQAAAKPVMKPAIPKEKPWAPEKAPWYNRSVSTGDKEQLGLFNRTPTMKMEPPPAIKPPTPTTPTPTPEVPGATDALKKKKSGLGGAGAMVLGGGLLAGGGYLAGQQNTPVKGIKKIKEKSFGSHALAAGAGLAGGVLLARNSKEDTQGENLEQIKHGKNPPHQAKPVKINPPKVAKIPQQQMKKKGVVDDTAGTPVPPGVST